MESEPSSATAPIVVPEIRDYRQINSELLRRLNLGAQHVRLEGVAGQRLLVSQLAGDWHAVIEILGDTGPELAAELDAPNLTVVCHGKAADGSGSGLRAGKLLIGGESGPVLGYFQRGGLIVAASDVGPRAGLNQAGGDLVLLKTAGPLTGERQSGGRLVVREGSTGPHAGHGGRGGRMITLSTDSLFQNDLDDDDRRVVEMSLELTKRFFLAS